MYFKTLFSLSLAICISNWSSAQEETLHIVVINGTVINNATKEPISARIKFESIPYGNNIGLFSGNTFTLNMETGQDYVLSVEADGYLRYSETLKVEDINEDHRDKVIELIPKEGNHLMRLEKLIFALGKADISDASYQELDNLADMLKENENMTIQLEGHTDFRGNARQNMKLSERRVEAVKKYLIKKGIDKKRIKTKAFGGNEPLSREDDDESRRNNRRVEVRILSD